MVWSIHNSNAGLGERRVRVLPLKGQRGSFVRAGKGEAPTNFESGMDEVRLTWASRWYALRRRSILLGHGPVLAPCDQDPGGVFTMPAGNAN